MHDVVPANVIATYPLVNPIFFSFFEWQSTYFTEMSNYLSENILNLKFKNVFFSEFS